MKSKVTLTLFYLFKKSEPIPYPHCIVVWYNIYMKQKIKAEFDREKHLYDEEFTKAQIATFKYVGAVDFGYRNPAAVLSAYWTGERLLIIDEWYKRERTDIQIAEYVHACKFKEVFQSLL